MSQKRTADTKKESAKTVKDERQGEINSLKQGQERALDYWTMVAQELQSLKSS